MTKPLHREILSLIVKNSGKPEANAVLDSYLGNTHPKYPLNNARLRTLARDWLRQHRELTPDAFKDVLTGLVHGKSCTEKMMAGIMMSCSPKRQRNFDPLILDEWLNHLEGWVEVDTVCTGDFIKTQLPAEWPTWKKLILKLSKDPNINKRRASLVLFCSPLGQVRDRDIAGMAFKIIERLKAEKDVRITKAVSWVLRTMIRHYRQDVAVYVKENADSLPSIAVRETMTKLSTGRKTKARTV